MQAEFAEIVSESLTGNRTDNIDSDVMELSDDNDGRLDGEDIFVEQAEAAQYVDCALYLKPCYCENNPEV